MIDKLNNAAIKEQTKNKWVLLKRSAKVKKANTKVPAIKPACIIDVTSAMLTGVENNLAKSSFFTPSKASVIIMWPVEETGKNSVRPSTTAIIIACKLFKTVK